MTEYRLERADLLFIGSMVALLVLGLIVMTSASIVVATQHFKHPFYYTLHQGLSMLVGGLGGVIISLLPVKTWFRPAILVMLVSLVALVLVLVPGISCVVNGSMRWLNLGLLHLQVSELCKLTVIIYLASYIVRHHDVLKGKVVGFMRPMLLLSLVGALLVLEPDFGAMVVILTTALVMLFLAGVPGWQFVLLLLMVTLVLAGVAVSAPYRLARLTSFLDPWAVQFGGGYQLTQALIAFGRGGWFGVGLGNSVQKLLYLPEAHTDFVFSVLAEELGLLGVLFTLGLYLLFVWRGIMIGLNAQRRTDQFAAFICYGVSIWVGLQTLINMGVNTGMLPTKGLTLPFISYGGSSMLSLCFAAGLIVRVDIENQLAQNQNQEITIGQSRQKAKYLPF